MNKRLLSTIVLLLFSLYLLFSETISFSGGESRLIMREGEKSVSLTKGAKVSTGSLYIEADEMNLSGDNWRIISSKYICQRRGRGNRDQD